MKPLPGAAQPRSGAIDLLRSALVVYVVVYLHLGTYIGDGKEHVHWSTAAVTNVVLGTFTFLSGHVLGIWKGSASLKDVAGFYGRRLVRVYPLYLVALAGFVAVWLVDPTTALKGAFAISMFWPEPPMTLWFVTMIIVCYLLAPALIIPSPRVGVILALALWTAMLAFNFVVHPIDERMLTQFAAFAAGVACRRHGVTTTRRLPIGPTAAAFAVSLAAAIATLDRPLIGAIAAVPSVIFGPLLLLTVADRFFADAGRHRIVVWLSYISFSAYLFHRIVFQAIYRWWWPSTEWAQWGLLLFIGVPVVLALASVIQRGYDRLLDRLSKQATQARFRATRT